MNTEKEYVFQRLDIGGYKSIQNVVIENVPPLMVLAGSNGSGKSNFVDSLKFISDMANSNIEYLTYGNEALYNFIFNIKVLSNNENINYKIFLDNKSIIKEELSLNEETLYSFNIHTKFKFEKQEKEINNLARNLDENWKEIKYRLSVILSFEKSNLTDNEFRKNIASIDFNSLSLSNNELKELIQLIQHMNAIDKQIDELQIQANRILDEEENFYLSSKFSLLQTKKDELTKNETLNNFISTLSNIKIFRINHLEAKKPSIDNANELKSDGGNIATILASLEQDDEMRETILEWLCLIVPEMHNVLSDDRHIDGSKLIQFEEESGKKFPAHLVSDGTIYALCMLVAVLTRTKKAGITIIEEPERGLHPKAIGELIGFMREHASTHHPIILTTHSESVVRELELDELFFVSKEQGNTHIKSVKNSGVDKTKIPLDTAWLTNTLDGGLPW